MSSSTSTSNSDDTNFYGALIDLPEASTPKLKAFALIFVIAVGIALAFIEWVNSAHHFDTQEMGLTLAELDTYHDRDFDTLILSDSVVRQMFWGVETSEGTAVLSVSASATLLGNEMIARRFFDQGNSVKTVVLGFSPPGLMTPLRDPATDAHFRPRFDRRKEKALVREKLGVDPYADMPQRRIFERRRSLIAFLKKDDGVTRRQRLLAPGSLLEETIHTSALTAATSKRVDALTKLSGSRNPFKWGNWTETSLVSLLSYLDQQDVKVKFVVPPMMTIAHKRFVESQLYSGTIATLNQYDAQLIDLNDMRSYPADAFYDSVHLYPIWEDRALEDMGSVLPRLLSSDARGSVNDFSVPMTLTAEDFVYRTGRRVIQNGEMGIISRRISIPIYSKSDQTVCLTARTLAEDKYSDSIFFKLNHGPRVAWHFRPTEGWANTAYKETLKLSAGWNHLAFERREDMPLATLQVKPCSG